MDGCMMKWARYVLVEFIFDVSCHPYICVHFEETMIGQVENYLFSKFCIWTSVVSWLIEVGGDIWVFCETGLECTYEVRLRAAPSDGLRLISSFPISHFLVSSFTTLATEFELWKSCDGTTWPIIVQPSAVPSYILFRGVTHVVIVSCNCLLSSYMNYCLW